MLLNGPQNPLTAAPFASPGNTFSVFTPDGETIVDAPDLQREATPETVRPGALKMWKVDIKRWFENHHLDKPGLYTLAWNFQGQKSEPFNISIPTSPHKAAPAKADIPLQ